MKAARKMSICQPQHAKAFDSDDTKADPRPMQNDKAASEANEWKN
jgi:hypothetical protein